MDIKESIKAKIQNSFLDMDTHAYNRYTDDSEYPIAFTVAELEWLYEELGGNSW